jgi:hypothetical protein
MQPVMEIVTNPFRRPYKSGSRQQSRKQNIERANSILTSYRFEFRQKLAEKSAEYAKFRRNIDEKMELEKQEIMERIKEEKLNLPKQKKPKATRRCSTQDLKSKEKLKLLKIDDFMKNSPRTGMEIDKYRGLVDKYETIIQRQIVQNSQRQASKTVETEKLRRIGGGFIRHNNL